MSTVVMETEMRIF